MTDQQLAMFAEKLYGAVLTTRLPLGAMPLIIFAIRQGIPWSRLPVDLKLSVLKIAAQCLDDLGQRGTEEAPMVLSPASSDPAASESLAFSHSDAPGSRNG